MTIDKKNIKRQLSQLTNVASQTLGARIVTCSDDFFAPAKRMLADSDAVFIADKFDDNGKWMDGWETRRRRDGGFDFCLLKLAAPSCVFGFDIDTSHFTGNYAPAIEIFGAFVETDDDKKIIANNKAEKINWQPLLPSTSLNGDTHHWQTVILGQSEQKISHLKVHIYPDGGIARLRVFGRFCFDETLLEKKDINVASVKNGARAIYANNAHFGQLANILTEHTPVNMADGWETRRRRQPGHDWGVIALARAAIVDRIVVDTKFFKGNYPARFSICAALVNETTDKAVISQSMFWQPLIAETPLTMDHCHTFSGDCILQTLPVNYIRLNIFPDGGIARLKLFGRFVTL